MWYVAQKQLVNNYERQLEEKEELLKALQEQVCSFAHCEKF